MAKFTRYPITFLWNRAKPQFDHGVVVAETADVIQFVWRFSPDSCPTLRADVADEGATWVRGHLHWWWPRHRQTKRAMLAAAAMGSSGVRLHESVATKAQKRADEMLNKVFGDFERVLLNRRFKIRRR